MADNNREAFAAHCSLQYGRKIFEFESDPDADVRNDSCFRALTSDIIALQDKFGALLI